MSCFYHIVAGGVYVVPGVSVYHVPVLLGLGDDLVTLPVLLYSLSPNPSSHPGATSDHAVKL